MGCKQSRWQSSAVSLRVFVALHPIVSLTLPGEWVDGCLNYEHSLETVVVSLCNGNVQAYSSYVKLQNISSPNSSSVT